MATIVNNPSSTDSGNGMSLVMGIVFIALLFFVFLVYGLPMMRQASTPAQVSVPDKIDVNVQGAK